MKFNYTFKDGKTEELKIIFKRISMTDEIEYFEHDTYFYLIITDSANNEYKDNGEFELRSIEINEFIQIWQKAFKELENVTHDEFMLNPAYIAMISVRENR